MSSLWLVQVLFFAAMLAVSEAGFRVGRRSGQRDTQKDDSQLSVIEAGILALLGVVLGFTLLMAVTRFEERKHLVLDEANAISTSFLRSQLLPAPDGAEISHLLLRYLETRLQYADVGDDLDRIKLKRDEAVRLQSEIWTRAVSCAQKDPNPVTTGLLLRSLNQAFELESARWAAIQDHVPATVIHVNGVLALLTALLLGYAFGIAGRRQLFSTCVLALAITVVLAVIVELDQPRRGSIRVSRQPLIDLNRSLTEK